MTKKCIAGLVWLLFATFLLQLAPSNASALTYYWGRHPDKERLVIVFPDKIPSYSVTRTGRTSLEVMLPEDYWETDAKPRPANFSSAKMLKRVKITRDGLEIQVRNPAFGYIQFPLHDRGKLVVDVFSDPIGAKWKPAGAADTPKQAKKKSAPPVKTTPAKEPAAKKKKPVVSHPEFKAPIVPKPAEKKTGPAPVAKQPEPAPVVETAPGVETAPQTIQQPAQTRQPAAQSAGQAAVKPVEKSAVEPSPRPPQPAKAAVPSPAPSKAFEPAVQPPKGGSKPEPAVKAAAKPEPKPGIEDGARPVKPAGQSISVRQPVDTPTPGAEQAAGKQAGQDAGMQPQAGEKATPPPVIQLPEEKPGSLSSGQTKQPFYTVPYSYRAPIIKDSTPLHKDPSSKVSPQPVVPQSPEQKLPEAKPQSSLFFGFPVGTAMAAEIHPPPQQLLAQNQAAEPEKNTFTVRQRIAPPSGASGMPQPEPEPETPPQKTSQTRQKPEQTQQAPATPVPPNPVPETTAYMERETQPKTEPGPAATPKPEVENTPYAVRSKIQRPGEESRGPLSRDALNTKPVAPAPEPPQQPAQTRRPVRQAPAGPTVSGKIAAPEPAGPEVSGKVAPPEPVATPEPTPAEAIPAPGSPPAQGVPWSGEQQLAMPLSQDPAAEGSQESPAGQAASDAPLSAPQRIRPPVVRTTPSPAPAQAESTQAESTQTEPGQAEREIPMPGAGGTPEADAAAESKVASDQEMEDLDNPYKTAREQQTQPAAQGAPENPEDQPPDFQQIILTGKAAMANEDYQNAYDVFEGLKKHPLLPSKLRKEVLYLDADALYSLSQDNMEENFSKVMSAYTEALNYDPQSIKASQAFYHLGVANLKVGNAREAEAYFNILKDKYPDDPQIPMIYYQWGQYYFEKNDFRKAADEFQYVVQKYPDNKVTLPASVFLARSLNELGLDEAAYKIVDYVQKRWPRYYTQYPPVLKLMGDVFYRMGELERSKASYWTYYNLDPKGDEADVILAHLGDIYLQTDHKETAVKVYEQTVEEFPNKEGGLIAQMRLAEQGVYDKPTLQQMFSIFDRPYSLKPSQVYTMIVDKFPDSPLAPLAQIKLSMWHLWNREYKAAINDVNNFQQKFPDDKLLDSAREVGNKAFDKLLELYIPEENYQAAVAVWNESPLLRSNEPNLTPKARVELATSFWKEGQPDQANKLLEPFFLSAAMPEQAQNALLLALNIALQQRDWKRILDLGKKVELWDLNPKTRYELDYNMALAYENQGETDKSSVLWQKLANSGDADPKQESYILYFMAQNARDKGEFKKAYTLAQQSLDYFLEHRDDEQKVKDLLALLIDITDTAGRTREALKWAIEYSRYVNRNDPDWPALRYRMAKLYKKLADMRKWRSILEELITTMPETLYGRMAKSDLNSQSLEQKAQQFVPSQSL